MADKKITQFPSGSISDSSLNIIGDSSTGALSQVTYLGMKNYFQQGLTGSNINTGSFLTTSSFNVFSSSYVITSASFDSRINNITGSGGSGSFNTSSLTPKFFNNFSNIYNKGYWTSSNDFSASGMTLNFATGSIILSSGSGDFSQFFILSGSINNDENVNFEITYTLTSAPTTSSFGLAIGKKSINTFFTSSISINADFTQLSGSGTFLRIGDGTTYTGNPISSIFSGSILSSIPSAGDMLNLKYSQVGSTFVVTFTNITKGQTGYAKVTSNLGPSFAGINFFPPNSGNFCVWNHGGNMSIQNIKIYSTANNTPKILFIGDSKTAGNGSNDIDLRFASLMKTVGAITVMAGGGDRTGEVVSCLPYIQRNIRPLNVVMCIGRNDLGSGVPTGTWQANYRTIANTFLSSSIPLYHLLPISESIDQSALAAFITSSYPSGNIIDPNPGWTNSVFLAADNVHPNSNGHRLVAYNILNSNIFTTGSDGYEYPQLVNTVIPPASSLSSIVTGSNKFIALFTSSNGVINSSMLQTGSGIGVNTLLPNNFGAGSYALQIQGSSTFGVLALSTANSPNKIQAFGVDANGNGYIFSNPGNTTNNTSAFITFNGNWGIGTGGVTPPTALLHVGASTAATASLRINSGSAPTSPHDGDIWYDSVSGSLKMSISGSVKTFTLV